MVVEFENLEVWSRVELVRVSEYEILAFCVETASLERQPRLFLWCELPFHPRSL